MLIELLKVDRIITESTRSASVIRINFKKELDVNYYDKYKCFPCDNMQNTLSCKQNLTFQTEEIQWTMTCTSSPIQKRQLRVWNHVEKWQIFFVSSSESEEATARLNAKEKKKNKIWIINSHLKLQGWQTSYIRNSVICSSNFHFFHLIFS